MDVYVFICVNVLLFFSFVPEASFQMTLTVAKPYMSFLSHITHTRLNRRQFICGRLAPHNVGAATDDSRARATKILKSEFIAVTL